MSACTLDLSAGSWLLTFASLVIRLLLARGSVGVFLFPSVLWHFHTLIRYTHILLNTQSGTLKPRNMSAFWVASLRISRQGLDAFFIAVCVPAVLHSTLRVWPVKLLPFFLLPLIFWGISLDNHHAKVTTKQTKNNINYFAKDRGKATFRKICGKLELEILHDLLGKQRCFVARRCVGGDVWEVQKWLSCYCSSWKHSTVTDSTCHGGYSRPFQHTQQHTVGILYM